LLLKALLFSINKYTNLSQFVINRLQYLNVEPKFLVARVGNYLDKLCELWIT